MPLINFEIASRPLLLEMHNITSTELYCELSYSSQDPHRQLVTTHCQQLSTVRVGNLYPTDFRKQLAVNWTV